MKYLPLELSMCKSLIAMLCLASWMGVTAWAGQDTTPSLNGGDAMTQVEIRIPENPAVIDPMIYGEMLEYCNDRIIYDGIVNTDGSNRPKVDALLKPLAIPITRWPGGTYSLEYHWREGVGPLDQRPTSINHAWGGKDNHRFGTDEFLQWCRKIGTQPYINVNMGTQPGHAGTLQEALDWIEYVNGDAITKYGVMRARNGHPQPYHVKYWGIGNENYYKRTAPVYAARLLTWATVIRKQYPKLQLLAVGHTYAWDQTILDQCGGLIDFLTQHYYMSAQIKEGRLQRPMRSLFGSMVAEAHIQKIRGLIDEANRKLGRERNPIRLSIDEWDVRHSVYKGKKFKFSRQDVRRQFDAAIVAGMLNVFIRQSPAVGMANYLFPANAHGLIKTVGDHDAYASIIYPVFKQYRQWMIGWKLEVNVVGPGIETSQWKLRISGDSAKDRKILTFKPNAAVPFVDAAAVITDQKQINIAVVNRSPDRAQTVRLNFPRHYAPKQRWELSGVNINSANMKENRENVIPHLSSITDSTSHFVLTIPPCGVDIVRCILKK